MAIYIVLHYVPILKREISNDTLVAFGKVRNVKNNFFPLLEVGRKKSTEDNKFVNGLLEVFDHIFVDYAYTRGQKEKGWNTELGKDIIDYLEILSDYVDLDLKSQEFYGFRVVPIISEKEHFQDENQLAKHFETTYQKAKNAGFKSIGVRISFHHLDYVPSGILRFVEKLEKEDFLLIDSKVYQLTEKDSVTNYDTILSSFITQIKAINPNVNVVLLNCKFKIRANGREIIEQLHWPTLKERFDIYGYGDYITELDSSGGGPSKGFNLSFYEYDTRLIRKFHSDTSESDLFFRISENKHIMGLIEQHKGYCKYCQKLKDNIDRRGFDREFLEEKGSLERVHHFNSISVNEFNSPHPSMA